ncbi:MAG: carbohydrate kinase [Bacteroidaceae bacterium]|nr:carbohydrate kinase [Bacteroidaceae bacterium]
MRRAIGIGETILDIIFRSGQPKSAMPGGATFNTMISLGRAGVPTSFVTDLGADRVGDAIRAFMRDNGVADTNVSVNLDVQSPVSLAFLDEKSNAEYEFYRTPFPADPDWECPAVERDDIVVMGSYYALDPQSRYKVTALLDKARAAGAIVYYDINFRRNHQAQAVRLAGNLLENYEYADIIRCSDEDIDILYGTRDSAEVYRKNTAFYCPRLICTRGAEGVDLHTGGLSKHYASPALTPVSTIGAGDSFNAGVIYSLLTNRIRREDLDSLDEGDWDGIVRCAQAFSANTCLSIENYVSRDFKP